MTLFLVGYMGSGKSVIGKIISEVLNYDYVDFDTYIETKEQATVSSLFKHKGEIYFRKAEQTYLQDILKMDRTVVSLGGGTPCYGDTMDRILASHQATTVYLKASIKTLTDRLFDERAKRPLIAHLDTKERLYEFIGKHLFERAPFYERSDITVLTDHKNLQEITEEIVLKLL